MKPLLPKFLLSALALAGAMTSSHATLLVYEGFNYSGTNNSTMAGVASTGTGVQGTWNVTNAQPAGGFASSLYQTTGLSFGTSYGTTTGGALRQRTSYSGSNAQTIATVQLNATSTGEIWGSYLVSYNQIGAANTGYSIEGIAINSSGTSMNLSSGVLSNTVTANRKLQVGYDSTTTASGNTAFLLDTTYIYISKYTNVGLGAGTAQTWVLDQTGYNNWVAGGATEGTLANFDLVTITDAGSGAAFDTTGYLAFRTDAPDSNGLQVISFYDEIRYGTTLADVYSAVPEPSATALLFGAGVSVLLFRRKRLV